MTPPNRNANASPDSNQNLSINSINNDLQTPSELAHYPVIHPQPIHWGEMDAFSHLNNVVFYRYAESARIAYLYALGMFDGDMVTVLAASSFQYQRPVTYPDTLLLGVRCQRLGKTSIVMEYEYYSTAQQAIVATAEAVVVRLDSRAEQKVAWTEEERARLHELETSVGHTPIYG